MRSRITSLYTLLTLLLYFFLSTTTLAQYGVIRGFIYESESGEPVIFTNVYLKKTSIGAATDINGYFAITRIPIGEYQLMVSYMGFDTLSIAVSVKANEIISKKLFLKRSSYNLEEVSISASRQDKRSQTQTSIIKISPKEISTIPSIGGQPDLAQYLQVLPGVVFSGDQGGQLYIRGGAPVQNKVLLDGMIIYNPFHSIGLFSVFDVDILKNVEVYTGGFGAEYGGRISSIMDVTTRDGNKNRIAGKVDVSTFGAKLLIEGPIAKAKTEDGTSASFIFSIKNSYLAESSKIFYNYIEEDGLPYNYLDIYGKISINASNGSKINVYGFNFQDNVKYKILQNYNWNNYGGGLNFIVIPGKSPVLLEGSIAYSNYQVNLLEKGKAPRSSSIGGFNAGFHFTYYFGRDALKYGIELSGFSTDFNFFNSVNRKIVITENSTEPSLFVTYKLVRGKVVINPGIRFQYYAGPAEASFEPRISIKYNVAERFRLKAAAGMYSQNLISTTFEKDVVNLFYGFLTAPDNLPETFRDGSEVKSKIQKCNQVVLGFELDMAKNISLNVEGYYKYYPQLTTLNRDKLYDENSTENKNIPDYLKKDFVVETGDAEGIDFSLKYDGKRIHLWGVYSLGFIHRTDGVNNYVPVYDRRHNVNLVGTFIFGKKRSWEFNARWNYGSGFPFTQTQGGYELINFSTISTDYTTANGELGIVYGDYNKGRLPYYSRLDVNLKKTFLFGEKKNTKLEINASITNALNQENLFYFDRIKYTWVNQMPLMPSLGISLAF